MQTQADMERFNRDILNYNGVTSERRNELVRYILSQPTLHGGLNERELRTVLGNVGWFQAGTSKEWNWLTRTELGKYVRAAGQAQAGQAQAAQAQAAQAEERRAAQAEERRAAQAAEAAAQAAEAAAQKRAAAARKLKASEAALKASEAAQKPKAVQKPKASEAPQQTLFKKPPSARFTPSKDQPFPPGKSSYSVPRPSGPSGHLSGGSRRRRTVHRKRKSHRKSKRVHHTRQKQSRRHRHSQHRRLHH